MKIFLYILFATHVPPRLPVNEEKLIHTYPAERKMQEARDACPDGWRFNSGEWKKILEGQMVEPIYYNDPTHGSNGGWELA